MGNHLPEQFQPIHDYCLFIHGQLSQIVNVGTETKLFWETFKLENEAQVRAIEGKSGEEFCQWMEKNGYEDVMQGVACKSIYAMLLADFCDFAFEALNCSEKGKLTVSFALLRKPFQETLFFLEWLFADPTEFMGRFMSKGLPFAAGAKLLERKKLLIFEVAKKIRSKIELIPVFDPEFIYELRYDSNFSYSLDPVFQKATHLITTVSLYKTEEQNFNFIFSNMDDKESQWEGFYTLVPILMFHTLLVAVCLLNEITTEAPDFGLNLMRSYVGLFVSMADSPLKEDAQRHITEAIDLLQIECPQCGSVINFSKENQKLFTEEAKLICAKCHHDYELYQNKL